MARPPRNADHFLEQAISCAITVPDILSSNKSGLEAHPSSPAHVFHYLLAHLSRQPEVVVQQVFSRFVRIVVRSLPRFAPLRI